MRNNKKRTGKHLQQPQPFVYLKTFSKIITVVWISVWAETVLFSQVATIFNLGDAASIQAINQNVVDIGTIITGFYFGKACLENIAQGVERHRERLRYGEGEYEDNTYEDNNEDVVG